MLMLLRTTGAALYSLTCSVTFPAIRRTRIPNMLMATSSRSESSSASQSHSHPKRVNLVVVGPAASESRGIATLDTLSRQYPQFASATRTRYNQPITHTGVTKPTPCAASVQIQGHAPYGLPQWAASLECCSIPIDTLDGNVSTALKLGLDIIHSIPAIMVCLTDHDDDTNKMHVKPLEEIVPYQPFIVITNQRVPGLPNIHTINTQNEDDKEKQFNLTDTSSIPFRVHSYPAPYHAYIHSILSCTTASSSESSSYYQVFDSARIDPLYTLHSSILGRRLKAIYRVAQNRSTPFFEFIGHDGRHTNATRPPVDLDHILTASTRETPLMPFSAFTNIVREYMYRYFHYHFSKYSFDTKSWFSNIEIDYFRSAIDLAAHNILFGRYTFDYDPDQQRDPILTEVLTSIYVNKDTVNPYRCGFGAAYNPQHILSKAKDILRIRNVPFQDDSHYSFYGIAYDIPKGLFKVYYIVRLRHAPKHLLNAVPQKHLDDGLRDFALVSWSYDMHKDSKPIEEKLYVYPNGPQEYVAMVSTTRGVLYQHECWFSNVELERQEHNDGAPHAWYEKLNSNGQKVLDELATLHVLPDAIEYVDKDKFTLYLPFWC